MLPTSSSARAHLQLLNWTNPLIQSVSERQRLSRRITTDVEQNHQRKHSRPLRNTTGRHLIQTSEVAKRRHTTHGRTRIQEQNVLNNLPTIANNNNQQDHHVESSDQSNVSIEEPLGCEITMSYASIPVNVTEKSNREEIFVIQRHSNDEMSLIYRGYLTKGETFSFKSQRRPTSSLSLAFYVEGSINYTIDECCEYKYQKNPSSTNDQKQFILKKIQKANPCQKCRKDHANSLLLDNKQNTLLVRRSKKSIHPGSNNIFKASSADDHVNDQQQKKTENPKSTYQHLQTIQPNSNPSNEKPIVPTVPSTEQPKPSSSTGYDMETSSSTMDAEDVKLMKQIIAAHFQQNQIQRMTRHSKSVENFCYVLENRLAISNEDQQTLRSLINLGFTFADINSKECIDFLKKIVDERIIYIITKQSMEQLSTPIANGSLLCAIYVIDSGEKCSFDSKFYRGCFPDMNTLCKQLKDDLEGFTHDLTAICSIPANYPGMSRLNYVQALKEILLENDQTRDLRKEMIDFCREEYSDNSIQLKFIDEFEKSFQANNAIQWYLREETFIYKMITRAFRVLDPDILFKLRYFIQYLYTQLNSCVGTSPLIVYRTLRIENDLFNKMISNQGSLLTFNEFLRVDKSQSITEPSPTNRTTKLVRFQINLPNGFAQYDITTKTNRILLNMGTLFLIDNIEQIDETIFTVQLSTNDDVLQAGQVLTKDLREAVCGPFPSVRMLKLTKQRKLTGYVEYFASMLIDDQYALGDEAVNLTLGGALHSLGSFYYEKKQYGQALVHLQNALKVYLRVVPDNDVRLTATYNNIGSIHLKQGLHEQALEYHRKAYEIQKNSSNPDMDSVSTYLGNIASVLMKLSRYNEALTYFTLELQLKQKLHPNNDHASLAGSYYNLGATQQRLQQYSEALTNYQKCLEIELKCHSHKNPTVAVTYFNMATTFEQLGQLQEAKQAMENAIKRLLLTKEETDQEVQNYAKYLQRLKEKLLLKSVFDTT